MLKCFTIMIGNFTEIVMEVVVKWKIADLLRVIIGLVLNNVNSNGNVEELELVKEVDGAVVMMAAI